MTLERLSVACTLMLQQSWCDPQWLRGLFSQFYYSWACRLSWRQLRLHRQTGSSNAWQSFQGLFRWYHGCLRKTRGQRICRNQHKLNQVGKYLQCAESTAGSRENRGLAKGGKWHWKQTPQTWTFTNYIRKGHNCLTVLQRASMSFLVMWWEEGNVNEHVFFFQRLRIKSCMCMVF